MPDSLDLVGNTVEEFLPGRPRLEGAPSMVELVHRAKGGRHLFHLVNFTGEMTRPIRRVMPVEHARLRLPAGLRATRARTLVSRRELSGGEVLELPRFDEYEVVVLETA
jgi:hypothetical protein